MKEYLANYLTNFSVKEQNLNTLKLFKYLILGWVFVHSAMLLPYGDIVWGPNAFNFIDFSFNDIRSLGVLLYDPRITPYYAWFVGAQLFVIVLAIFDIWPKTMMVILYLITINLNTRGLAFTSGGTTLTELLIVYLMFVNTTGIETKLDSRFAKLKISLHNLFFLILRLQIVVIYFTAVFAKFSNPFWSNGVAVYYIFQNNNTSQPWTNQFFMLFPQLAILGNYTTQAFQFLFPFLAWFKKTSPYIILVGVGLHLMMSYVMGLFLFGILMCISYVLFLDDNWIKAFFNLFQRKSYKKGVELSPV